MTWNVYELHNDQRKELFVGMTEKDVGAQYELNRAVPPHAIRGWDFESERVRCQGVKTGLTRNEAREAIRLRQPPPGWTILKEV